MKKILAAVRRYFADAKADFTAIALATAQPVSRRAAGGMGVMLSASALFMNLSVAFAASTPLFQKFQEGLTTLLTDAQEIMSVVATFALIICVIGVFIASMLGPKATSTMTSALKLVIGLFIFVQLIPVLLTTIETVFGSGAATT